MKKIIVATLVAVPVVAAAGGGAWYMQHTRDPLAQAKQYEQKGDLTAARLEWRNVVRNDPQNPEAHARLGRLQLVLGDPVAAEKELRAAHDLKYPREIIDPSLARAVLAQGRFEDVVRQFPTDGLPPDQATPLLITRAVAQLSLNKPDDAQATVDVAEKLGVKSVDVPLAAARVALAKRDAKAAEEKVDQALAIDSHSIEALILKSQLQEGRGARTDALATLDAAVGLAPASIAPRLERAGERLNAGKDEDAKSDVQTVLKADGRNPRAIFYNAILLLRGRDWKAADQELQKIAALLPRLPRGDYFLSYVKANLGQTEQATDAATRYVAQAPRDPDGYALLANLHIQAGRPADAADVLNRAVANGAATPDLLDLLAKVEAQNGRPDRAQAAIEKAEALAAGNATMLAKLAATKLGLGDASGAATMLEHSLDLAPQQQGNAGGELVLAALAAGDVERAQAGLDRLHQQNADPQTVGILTGMVRQAQLDLPGARAAFESVLKDHPDSLPAKLNLARVMANSGQPAEAEKLFAEVLAKQPLNPTALSSLVGLKLNGNHVDEAIALLTSAHATTPTNVGLAVALADLQVRAGDPKTAMATLDGIPPDANKGPAANAILAARARVLTAQSQPKEAVEAYRKVLAQVPADLGVRAKMMELMIAGGDTDGFRAALRDGLQISPGNFGLLQASVALEFRQHGFEAALAEADRLVQDSRNLPNARTLKGDVYVNAKKFDDAAAAYEAALKVSPSSALALRTFGALSAGGHKDDAAKMLRAWAEKNPDDLDAAQSLSELDLVSGRLDESQRQLEAILAKRPNAPAALNNLAWIYQQKNDKRAQATARKAYLLAPGPQTADTLGWILAAGGEPGPALLLLRQSAAQMQTDPGVHFHLASVLKDSGNLTEAAAVLKPFMSDAKPFPEREAAQKLFDSLPK